MTEQLSVDKILRIISKAWGRQKGYCFFPSISGSAKDKKERIMSYRENEAFLWPRDRQKILEHMEAHRNDDLYWCPSLFEMPKRKMELAMDEHALWADLDEVDPREIDDYQPTIAWETSPGRFQALWLMHSGDIQGASWSGHENQKMTYHLGADQAGWDTTQLMRLPTWNNHKPEYRKDNGGKPQRGRLLWQDGRRYTADEFSDLPDVPNGAGTVAEILEDEVLHVDWHAVWGRVRLKVSKRVREYVRSRDSSIGDRSEILWQIERELADAGCSVTEIVAVVRNTVWNKFEGRSDELRRLTTEAAKAVAQRPDDITERLEEEWERPSPTNLFVLVAGLKPPTWLVRDILTEGACGFIAGQPKSFKSWAGLDLALSVASGQPFLGHFMVERPGPTLYLQEEDSAPLVKARLGKVWPAKISDKITLHEGKIVWDPPIQYEGVVGLGEGNWCDIDAYIGNTFTISDESWQSWLDEQLMLKSEAVEGGYRLIVMDPLMMMAGDVEENRAQEMTTKIFRPLKELARKWNVAIQMIHHMKKSDPKAGPQRGGQMLLGSVANHAWAEDSMYFKLGRGGDIICEQESKNAPVPGFRMTGIRNRRWNPIIVVNSDDTEREPDGAEGPIRSTDRQRSNDDRSARTGGARKGSGRPSKVVEALRALGPGDHAVTEIAEKAGVARQSVYSAMARAEQQGIVTKRGSKYELKEG